MLRVFYLRDGETPIISRVENAREGSIPFEKDFAYSDAATA
jgi:hypothetical protein